MARVNARQAYTRAKTKRQKSKAETQKAMIEARMRYIRQLSNVGIAVDTFYGPKPSPRNPTRQTAAKSSNNSGSKKITDYFAVTKNLDLMHRVVKTAPITSSTVDPSGVEIITIYDSEHEANDDNDDNNNNNNNNNNGKINNNDGTTDSKSLNNENLNSSMDSSLWDSSFDSNDCDRSIHSGQRQQQQDVKPLRCKLDLSNLGTSFEDLKLKVQVDEDIEIVDMLPPIPLRNHPVFEVDE